MEGDSIGSRTARHLRPQCIVKVDGLRQESNAMSVSYVDRDKSSPHGRALESDGTGYDLGNDAVVDEAELVEDPYLPGSEDSRETHESDVSREVESFVLEEPPEELFIRVDDALTSAFELDDLLFSSEQCHSRLECSIRLSVLDYETTSVDHKDGLELGGRRHLSRTDKLRSSLVGIAESPFLVSRHIVARDVPGEDSGS